MKVSLKSDFHDYYDHCFDLDGIPFNRYSRQGVERRAILDYLSETGFQTPIYGTPQEIYEKIDTQLLERERDFRQKNRHFLEVIVYLADNAHRGEDKVLIPLYQAINKYPNHLCTLFISPLPGSAKSLRYLQIGNKNFRLQYTSKDDWRSNRGDVEIKVLTHGPDGYHPRVNYPLFAVDFIFNTGEYIAIDFNTSPVLEHTGIEEILAGEEVVKSINEAIVHYQNF